MLSIFFNAFCYTQAVEMIENIRAEFRQMLKDEVTWMDKESKAKADEKVKDKETSMRSSLQFKLII